MQPTSPNPPEEESYDLNKDPFVIATQEAIREYSALHPPIKMDLDLFRKNGELRLLEPLPDPGPIR